MSEELLRAWILNGNSSLVSGIRLLFATFLFIGWLVEWLIGWLIVSVIGWLVDWLVGWLIG